MGTVAYKLLLPDTCKIHPIFYVSQLKLAKGSTFQQSGIPAQLSPNLELLCEPEAVLAVRRNPVDTQNVIEVLIKWQHLPEYDATWECNQNINSFFPHFHLEGKVKFIGADIDMTNEKPKIQQVYTRRGKK